MRFIFLYLHFLGMILAGCSPEKTAPAASTPYLLVLGIAQDAGYPQADCHRDCCRPAWEKEQARRRVSCLAVVDPLSAEGWLLDATPDFKDQLHALQQQTGAGLSGLFLTHAHIGHYTGLMQLGREVMGADRMPVFAMPRMRDFLTQNGPWSQLLSLQNIRLLPLQADSTVRLNDRLRLTPFLVPHRDEFSETAGFHIEGPTHSALFIPDIDKWERWDRNIDSLIQTVDYAFLDGTFFAEGEIPGRDMSQIPHPFVSESLERFSLLPATEREKVHFIHFNHTNPVLWDAAAARRIRAAGCRVAEQGQKTSL